MLLHNIDHCLSDVFPCYSLSRSRAYGLTLTGVNPGGSPITDENDSSTRYFERALCA